MSISIIAFDHANVRVPRELEEAAKRFYGTILGLQEVPKPEQSRGRGGAWYQLGTVQLHLSLGDGVENQRSKRHVCLLVADLARAKEHLEKAGVEIFPDDEPVSGCPRFYVRDPGSNLIEIAKA